MERERKEDIEVINAKERVKKKTKLYIYMYMEIYSGI